MESRPSCGAFFSNHFGLLDVKASPDPKGKGFLSGIKWMIQILRFPPLIFYNDDLEHPIDSRKEFLSFISQSLSFGHRGRHYLGSRPYMVSPSYFLKFAHLGRVYGSFRLLFAPFFDSFMFFSAFGPFSSCERRWPGVGEK